MSESGDVTELLLGLRADGGRAVDRLLPLVYDELRAIAANRMQAERQGHTLSATALVHEAYLKLVDQTRADWKNRAHFFSIAATAMRRILLDHAIARKAEKRGGGAVVVTLGDESASREAALDEMIAVDAALSRLAALDERQGKVVELRFFGGLTMEELAEVLGISLATANRDWRLARAFLTVELAD